MTGRGNHTVIFEASNGLNRWCNLRKKTVHRRPTRHVVNAQFQLSAERAEPASLTERSPGHPCRLQCLDAKEMERSKGRIVGLLKVSFVL